MSDLAIRFTIDTPIALNQLLHLDSLLARISADRGLGVEDLSLDRTGDIYHASAAILETGNFGAVQQETTRVKSVRSADIPTGVFDRVPRRGRAINEMSPYRSQLQGYNTYLGVKAVWFTAKGVRSSLERMAASVTNLGAMASTGYGRVSGVDIFDLPSHPRTGLHLPNRLPCRAIPKVLWDSWGMEEFAAGTVISEARAKFPYWSGSPTVCVMPTQMALIQRSDQVSEFIGVS
jgi:hypothetical protein